MGNILGLGGETLAVVKEAHIPERVERRRQQLSKLFREAKEAWAKDNMPDPEGATVPNAEAIDLHHAEKWRQNARVAQNAQEPVEVDAEQMATWIAEQRKEMAIRGQYHIPLKDVLDLTPWGFKPVGACELGKVWLSDRAALCIADEGMVHLELRQAWCGAVNWAEKSRLDAKQWLHAHELPDYTLGELFNLLTSLRVDKLVALPEALMAMGRAKEVKEPVLQPTQA